MTKQELVEKKETQVASVGFDYGNDSGEGFEGTTASDLSIPFINILQSNSPEITDETIPGASMGDLVNTVTKELTKGKDGFVFIPVHKEEAWVEWIPRDSGGGLAGTHSPTSDLIQSIIAKNGGSKIPPKGSDGKRVGFKNGNNELVETFYVYGLVLSEDGNSVESFAVLSFSSTKIKPYRDWMTSMYMLKGKPPLFANRARIKTEKQKNSSGTFANFSISPFASTWAESLINPRQQRHLLDEAKSFREMVMSGVAKADVGNQDGQVSTSRDSSNESVDASDAPF